MKLRFFAVPFLLAVASCTPIKLVEPTPQAIGQSYRVKPTAAWNGLTSVAAGPIVSEQWSKDGWLLNGMNFWHDIEEGSALFEVDEVEFPKFKTDMRATEVQEFFVSSKTKRGVEDVEATNLRPAKFGSAEGFRFDFTFLSPEGLKMRGMVLAAMINQKLQLIEYWATDAHYFEQNADEVEKIFETIELISS